jgi:hypothetical protein
MQTRLLLLLLLLWLHWMQCRVLLWVNDMRVSSSSSSKLTALPQLLV